VLILLIFAVFICRRVSVFSTLLRGLYGTSAWSVVPDYLKNSILSLSVPQGSVLGPLLFLIHTAELADIATKYNVTLHAFGDDNQLYIHCHPKDVQLQQT